MTTSTRPAAPAPESGHGISPYRRAWEGAQRALELAVSRNGHEPRTVLSFKQSAPTANMPQRRWYCDGFSIAAREGESDEDLLQRSYLARLEIDAQLRADEIIAAGRDALESVEDAVSPQEPEKGETGVVTHPEPPQARRGRGVRAVKA